MVVVWEIVTIRRVARRDAVVNGSSPFVHGMRGSVTDYVSTVGYLGSPHRPAIHRESTYTLLHLTGRSR
jgi:hypothetical protein